MHSDNFDLSAYFRRINYTGQAAADTATLHALMRHQLFSIPFENGDVQAGKVVSLVPEDIADKLLRQKRGGYCYEVNGLFAMALEALGIRWRFVAARPIRLSRSAEGEYLLQARVEGKWASQYGFDLSPQEWIDFVPANYLNSTHPDAIFVQKLLVVQHRPEGRQILLGNVLKTITAQGVETQQLAEDDIASVLKNCFALTVE